MGCPTCHLLYQSISPADLADKRIALVHVRLFGDSQVCHTFDPGTEDMSRKLCAEEGKSICYGRRGRDYNVDTDMIGFNKGGWVAGPDYPTSALYPPVERPVELFSIEG